MELGQLRAVIAVADHGGFSAAADALFMSQSAVSRAVASLERELGVELVVRGRPRATLTLAGETAVSRAKAALSELNALASLNPSAPAALSGKIRLASFPSVAGSLLPPLLASFSRQFRTVRVVLLEGTEQEVHQWLESDLADLAIMSDPPSEMQSQLIAEDRMVAVVHPSHPCAHREQVELQDLLEGPFILPTGGCEITVRALFRQAHIPLRPAHHVRETRTIIRLVAENLGVSIVPALSIGAERVDIRLCDLQPLARRPLYAVYKMDCGDKHRVSVLADFLKRNRTDH